MISQPKTQEKTRDTVKCPSLRVLDLSLLLTWNYNNKLSFSNLLPGKQKANKFWLCISLKNCSSSLPQFTSQFCWTFFRSCVHLSALGAPFYHWVKENKFFRWVPKRLACVRRNGASWEQLIHRLSLGQFFERSEDEILQRLFARETANATREKEFQEGRNNICLVWNPSSKITRIFWATEGNRKKICINQVDTTVTYNILISGCGSLYFNPISSHHPIYLWRIKLFLSCEGHIIEILTKNLRKRENWLKKRAVRLILKGTSMAVSFLGRVYK